MTGAEECVIEAGWGLGEVVVSSRIVPDYFRLDADGGVVEQVPGDKDVRLVRDGSGGTKEMVVPDELRRVPCLGLPQLQRLHALARRCREVWNGHLDLEFAFAVDDSLYLLQSRPITATGRAPA
jgi:pyruvate,water dikinase